MWITLNTKGGFVTRVGIPTGPEIHEFVGGYFEVVRIKHDILMWLNEEGKLIDLPMNRGATMLAHMAGAISEYDYIAGNVVFTGSEDDHGDHTALTGNQHLYLEKELIG